MFFTKFNPPAKKVLASELTERLQRTQKACSANFQTLIPNKTVDKAEIDLKVPRQLSRAIANDGPLQIIET